MISLNRVLVAGNLTRDPELKVTASNRKVTLMTLAINDFWKNQNGETVKKATFLTIVAWGPLAENCAKYLKKGRAVMVEGRIETDSYEDKNGKKRNITRINSSSVVFLENSGKKDLADDETPEENKPVKAKSTAPTRKVIKRKAEESEEALIL